MSRHISTPPTIAPHHRLATTPQHSHVSPAIAAIPLSCHNARIRPELPPPAISPARIPARIPARFRQHIRRASPLPRTGRGGRRPGWGPLLATIRQQSGNNPATSPAPHRRTPRHTTPSLKEMGQGVRYHPSPRTSQIRQNTLLFHTQRWPQAWCICLWPFLCDTI